MTDPKWKRHGTLSIGIAYDGKAKSLHDGLPLRHESLTLDFFRMDYDLLGLPQRLWLVPVTADGETKKCRVEPEEHGRAILEGLSSETLEILRNGLAGLAREATAVLNARGSALYGLPEPKEGKSKARLGSGGSSGKAPPGEPL